VLRLNTAVGGLELKHPVMVGSGVLGDKPELVARVIREGNPSAVVTKTITKYPREGYVPPVIVELGSCTYINAVGLANPGAEAIPKLVSVGRWFNTPIIVSIAGGTVNEFTELASAADSAGASAIELNLSCPHVRGLGAEVGRDAGTTYAIVKDVASITKSPIWAKLGPWDNVTEVVAKVLEAGAKALVLTNTIKAMKIDVYSMKPVLTAGVGGLSGDALHPIAVRVVYEVFKEFHCDIVGVGGVKDSETAIEFLLAGAKAVQVVSAVIRGGPQVINEIVRGIENYMNEVGIASLDKIIGGAHS